jgi:hypothetical protein
LMLSLFFMVNSEMSVMIDAADETSVRRVDVTMSHPPLLTVIARNPNRRRANFSKPRNARIPSVQRVAASFGALDPIADGFQLGGKRSSARICAASAFLAARQKTSAGGDWLERKLRYFGFHTRHRPRNRCKGKRQYI